MDALIAWLATWWPTVLICIGLSAFVGLLIFGLIRDRKKGGCSSCCGGCGGCAMSGACPGHQDRPSDETEPKA